MSGPVRKTVVRQLTGREVCWPFAQALLRNFAAGEARLDVADAALQIGAEDDALVSHSPVALPVPACPLTVTSLLLLQPLAKLGVVDVPCQGTAISHISDEAQSCACSVARTLRSSAQVDAFKGRIARLAADLSRNCLPQLPPGAAPEAVLQAGIFDQHPSR